MAGHSHWARIKRKKGVTDARRGRLWSKLSRAIIVAAKAGGPDPDANLALRYAIDAAKAANMPKDTIENAVRKGAGGTEATSYETVYYEGYGAGGVAVLVEALTDNRNRTAPEVKKIFERAGGSVGGSGCVKWMFSSKGIITVPQSAADEDRIAEIALEGGAEDYQLQGDVWEITCSAESYEPVRQALATAKIEIASSELTMVPSNRVTVDADNGQKVLKLIEALEDHDDVQNVYSNFDIPEDVMATLG
ncbi:MAG TPA: YebC/PmpR family DNA-binding transcriptional regulator [Phycisphaerae bacterium]|nr:YebC/PmpR family DNA-binding transcriptional regulator [Phycisphaerae bacterium]HOJ76105.1 YebC/PmpR family DNA-binding transcriptional regulator [Phycisphaerae bacterium]HOM51853.1 YebC/PmpR family DNA-binding transcriptional regulator [Phycisphaerae bacterium]HON65777.1 YebC/PmpR family DNA-binding transcriptional regulator [Phycisphaerae bacterium]HOQ88118.1 YebC/PmpR family DNA-binding transcriptional regulator [Phycisphaerae bacterium]